ncbi:hypothetical protein CHU92_09980 [Flavobacterium cyanobacteriorum]|uniref:TPM domain-containing protein n=1 Tax=Flavobacterium cyanobacteriorum TaxID=2022802 RepID=A0A255Z4D0_9FLAO|nr:hypothetical protein [Flavobacterium cyanobacteriorum]OYQ36338.1 hypothetical protein CHU92_09980 [Flavobacterium cyanobacteriorum]
MKKILFFLFLFACLSSYSQSINDYKYVIVPEIYDFQKKKNEYNLNTMTKLLLEKYGFTVYIQNSDYPADLALNKCLALYADVLKRKGFLTNILTIQLKDCDGNVIYMSGEGRSKEKSHQKSYLEAFRRAAESFNGLMYKYNGNAGTVRGGALYDSKAGTVSQATTAKPVNNDNLLTAIATGYGYDLLDKAGKVVIKMYKTTQADYYSAKMETITGIVFKKEGDWVFEFYDRDDKPVSQKLNIRF